jgi:hypothetical protein
MFKACMEDFVKVLWIIETVTMEPTPYCRERTCDNNLTILLYHCEASVTINVT